MSQKQTKNAMKSCVKERGWPGRGSEKILHVLCEWFLSQLHYHDAGSVPARHPNGRNGRNFWEGDDSSLATPTPVQQLSDVSGTEIVVIARRHGYYCTEMK